MTEKRQQFLNGLQTENKNLISDGDRIFAAMEESANVRQKLDKAKIIYEKAKKIYEEARKNYDEAKLDKDEAKRIARENADGSKEQSVFAAMELSGTSRRNLEKAEIDLKKAEPEYLKAKAEYEKALNEKEEAKRDLR